MTRLQTLLIGTAMVAAAMTLALEARQQKAVFRSRGESVRLDVLVSDGGRPISGLTARDFIVRDNGVVQKVDFVGYDEVPINLVLTFDISGSVTGRRLEDLRSAGHAALDQLRDGDRAALVAFTHVVSLGSSLTNDFALVRQLLDGPGRPGQTSLIDATFAGLISGIADNGRSLMLVFTDGVDTASWIEPEHLLEAAKLGDVVVFGVSAGRLRVPIVKTLAEATGGEMFEVRSTEELRSTFVQLIREYRQRYLVAYMPTGTASGWHAIDVQVSKRGAAVKARPGYLRR